MGKVGGTVLLLVPGPGNPLVAVVLALGMPDVMVIKGEVEGDNCRGAYFDGTVTTMLSRSNHRKPLSEYTQSWKRLAHTKE